MLQRFNNLQPCSHCALGIVLVCLGIAKVHQQPISQILGDTAPIRMDHASAGLLIRPHHLAPFFRVEFFRERGGAHQVTEHHRQLPPLGGVPSNIQRLGSRVCVLGAWY